MYKMLMLLAPAFALPVFVLVAPACDNDTMCTTEAKSSVVVKVVDESNNPVTDANVTYAVDGGEREACDSMGDTFVCAWEVKGKFTIKATRDGESAEESVEVLADKCHVITQNVELKLMKERSN